MGEEEEKEAVYDEKVERTLAELGAGKSREQLADEMGYSSYKSLDKYMRRRNFAYDSGLGNYVPKKQKELRESGRAAGSSKVEMVLTLLEVEGLDDPREVARKAGFSDHLRLAEFMQERGYTWDGERSTYVFTGGSEGEESGAAAVEESPGDEGQPPGLSGTGVSEGSEILLRLGKFLPLLELLDEKKEELEELLKEEEGNMKQPNNYAIRGEPMNKNVYMSRLMGGLLEEFSDLHGMSQREVVEAALVDFFRENGFDRVEDILSGD